MKLRGIVRGQTIVLDEPLGLKEGQQVDIEVHPLEAVDLEQYGIKSIPPSGYTVTNEIINKIRYDIGI